MDCKKTLENQIVKLIEDMLPYAIRKILKINERKIAARIADMANQFLKSKLKE